MQPARPGRKYGIRTQTYGPNAHVLPDVRHACEHDRRHARLCLPHQMCAAAVAQGPSPTDGPTQAGQARPGGGAGPIVCAGEVGGRRSCGATKAAPSKGGRAIRGLFPAEPCAVRAPHGFSAVFSNSWTTARPPAARTRGQSVGRAVQELGERPSSWRSQPKIQLRKMLDDGPRARSLRGQPASSLPQSPTRGGRHLSLGIECACAPSPRCWRRIARRRRRVRSACVRVRALHVCVRARLIHRDGCC